MSNEKEQNTDKCPTCGGVVNISWSGLELVENTGDETLATKHYTSIPSFEETQYESLRQERDRLREEMADIKKKAEFTILILEGENRSLRADKLKIQQEAGLDPYWYFPQCNVEGCEQVSCSGGGCWRETGYWSICPDHSKMFRDGSPQPKMKQSAIDREATRDENGHLPAKLFLINKP